jgi:hypothetical protein
MNNKSFLFWTKYLQVVSLLFSAIGLMWLVVGSFDPFGIYDTAFARTFWHTDTLPSDVRTAFRFILGPFGATSAGYFILQYFIAKYAYALRLRWGYNAIMVAFFFWFFTDTAFSLWMGAYFNVLMANIPSLIAMLPIIFTRRYFA